MKFLKAGLLLLVLGTVVVDDALAGRGGHRHHHGHGVRLGLFVGPFWSPWAWSPYYPPVVVEHAPPPVYIERSSESAAANFWYYCRAARAYYPYVKDCPAGWEKVAPRPEDQP